MERHRAYVLGAVILWNKVNGLVQDVRNLQGSDLWRRLRQYDDTLYNLDWKLGDFKIKLDDLECRIIDLEGEMMARDEQAEGVGETDEEIAVAFDQTFQ